MRTMVGGRSDDEDKVVLDEPVVPRDSSNDTAEIPALSGEPFKDDLEPITLEDPIDPVRPERRKLKKPSKIERSDRTEKADEPHSSPPVKTNEPQQSETASAKSHAEKPPVEKPRKKKPNSGTWNL